MNKREIIVVGTDYKTLSGGVAYALNALVSMLKSNHVSFKFLPSHTTKMKSGKWKPFLRLIIRFPLLMHQLHRQGKDVIVYAHAGGFPSLIRKSLLLCLARCLGAETYLQVHSVKCDTYLSSKVKKYFVKALFLPAHKLCVLTPWWKTRLESYGITKTICIVPNVMSLECEEEGTRIRESHQHQKSIQIFCMTRLESGKGVDVLISALSRLPKSYRLVIAGDGGMAVRLRQQVEVAGLNSRVHFLGWVNEAQKNKWFNSSDIFCLPSSFDSFGMVFIEAMSRGLPVVALDNGPVAEVVPDGHVGFLSKENTPGSVAESIMKLDSAQLRCELGKNAKTWVLKKYSQYAVYKIFKEVFFSNEPHRG